MSKKDRMAKKPLKMEMKKQQKLQKKKERLDVLKVFGICLCFFAIVVLPEPVPPAIPIIMRSIKNILALFVQACQLYKTTQTKKRKKCFAKTAPAQR